MTTLTAAPKTYLFVIPCCLIFVTLGFLVMPYPGVQNDEAFFAAPVYSPYSWHAKIRVFHHDVPTMLLSYLGTLKTLIYFPLLRFWAPSVISIRFPVLLVGAATIWLSFLLADRMSGRRAALVAVVLLATDATFLFTTCFDWGPVALQLLLLVSGVLALLRFHQEGGKAALCCGFLFFGLGIWDKALFAWPLSGIGVASLIMFPGELRRHLNVRNSSLALFCFILGAFPLLAYNFKTHGETFRANVGVQLEANSQKLAELEHTLNGSVLLGYMVGEDWMDHPRSPGTPMERFSSWIRDRTGNHRGGLRVSALSLALLLIPWLWRTPARRPLLFCLIFLGMTWIEMFLTAGAGSAVHHVVLLWPFPFLFLATAFDGAARRIGRFGAPALVLAVAVLAGENLLVYNQHLAQFIRDGGAGSWTNAIFPLSTRLRSYGANKIYITDWGMFDSLRLLDQGQLKLEETVGLLKAPALDETEKRLLRAHISDPDHVFVRHTAAFEEFKGVGEHLLKWARDLGYEPEYLETVCDGNGRPVFEILRFRERLEAKAAARQPDSALR